MYPLIPTCTPRVLCFVPAMRTSWLWVQSPLLQILISSVSHVSCHQLHVTIFMSPASCHQVSSGQSCLCLSHCQLTPRVLPFLTAGIPAKVRDCLFSHEYKLVIAASQHCIPDIARIIYTVLNNLPWINFTLHCVPSFLSPVTGNSTLLLPVHL